MGQSKLSSKGWTRDRAHQTLRTRIAASPESLATIASRIGVNVETLRGWVRAENPHRPVPSSRSALEAMFAIPRDAWRLPRATRPVFDLNELKAKHRELLQEFIQRQNVPLDQAIHFWTRDRAHQALRELLRSSPLIRKEVAQYLGSGTTSIERWKDKENPRPPTKSKREAIERLFGIPCSAWDQ